MTILDISHHQAKRVPPPTVATIDMQLVKASGCELVIVRQNYGLRPDEAALQHNQLADNANLPRLVYWYNLSRKDPIAMARLCFELSGATVGRRGLLDIEESTRNDGAEPQ